MDEIKGKEERAVIALMVENNAGVLARVAMLFGRRGFNIDSLTVSITDNPKISRITITTAGDRNILKQIILQTKKLVEVLAIKIENPENVIQRELLLVKLATSIEERSKIIEICDIYKADIVDLSPESLIIELTGKPAKIDALLDVLAPYEITELCRTGMTTIGRGSNTLEYVCEELHNA